jgi:hypothetical protein
VRVAWQVLVEVLLERRDLVGEMVLAAQPGFPETAM